MSKGPKLNASEDLKRQEQIKKLVIIAVFSDDELMERLVLKGGNAIDLLHHLSARASVDVDFSMESDFSESERQSVRDRLERNLRLSFRENGYEVFDVKMEEKPSGLTPDMADFWGGYSIEFKIIEKAKLEQFSSDLDALRRNAVRLGQGSKFLIDISKFEYTRGKEPLELDGFRIFVYTPEMIVCEKIRAICQQMPEYGPIVKRNRAGSARARDFVDIYTLVTRRKMEQSLEKLGDPLRHMFAAKRAPLALLGRIKNYREFHRSNFASVLDTIKAGVHVEEFDFYFDFVVAMVERLLKVLGDK